MKYLVVFYSGAGNTECIARKIAHSLEEEGHEVSTTRLTGQNVEDLDDDFDALVLGFPIYFRAAPGLVFHCLRTLDGRNRPIIVFSTKGMYSCNATRAILSLAEERCFIPKGFHEFYMPGSDILLIFAKKGSFFERSFKFIHSRKIDRKIERLLNGVQGDSTIPLPRRKWYTLIDEGIIKRIEIKATDHYRIFIGRFHSMPEQCTQCLKCVRQCPRGNIEMTDSGIVFGQECDTCFRCIHQCPSEAIQIGDKTLDTVRYRPVTCNF